MFWSGENLPLHGTGTSLRVVWKRGFGDWRSGGTRSLWKAKNLVMVCDKELYKYSLVAALKKGHGWQVCRHWRAQKCRAKDNAQISRGHLVLEVS